MHRLALLAALAVLLAGTAARDGGGLGPALDPNRLSQLPREGLAAELDHRLVLVSARGRVLGHLDDFTLAEEPALDQIAPGPRPLELRDRFAVRSELREGRLVPTRARLRLARGAVLELEGGRWTLRGSRVGFVSEHRDLVTFFGRRSARVLDLRSGSVGSALVSPVRISVRERPVDGADSERRAARRAGRAARCSPRRIMGRRLPLARR